MAEYEYRFFEYDFNRGEAGSQEPQSSQMNKMSAAGWEIESSSVAFPLASVLWKREVKPAPPPAPPAARPAPAKAADS